MYDIWGNHVELKMEVELVKLIATLLAVGQRVLELHRHAVFGNLVRDLALPVEDKKFLKMQPIFAIFDDIVVSVV